MFWLTREKTGLVGLQDTLVPQSISNWTAPEEFSSSLSRDCSLLAVFTRKHVLSNKEALRTTLRIDFASKMRTAGLTMQLNMFSFQLTPHELKDGIRL